jgi:hypothetical protein
MTNPTTTDRRDVAHATNPLGGDGNIEKEAKTNLAEPLDGNADKLPPAGAESRIRGMPAGAKPGDVQTDGIGGMPHDVPPARSGQSQEDVQPAAPDEDNPRRMDQQRADGRDTVHVQSPRTVGQ